MLLTWGAHMVYMGTPYIFDIYMIRCGWLGSHLNVASKISMPYECYFSIYGRPALIILVTSMDDSEKEFTSIRSVEGTARSQGKSHVSCKATKSYCFTNSATYSLLVPAP